MNNDNCTSVQSVKLTATQHYRSGGFIKEAEQLMAIDQSPPLGDYRPANVIGGGGVSSLAMPPLPPPLLGSHLNAAIGNVAASTESSNRHAITSESAFLDVIVRDQVFFFEEASINKFVLMAFL